MSDERRTITAPEAQATLGIPASAIRAWASLGRLYPVGIGARNTRLYRLADIIALAQTTRRRATHHRPSRCLVAAGDIA